METFEKQNLNQDKNTENKKPVNRVLQTAAKGTINWLKRNWKNSALLVAGGALSTGAFAQDPNNNERDVVNNQVPIENLNESLDRDGQYTTLDKDGKTVHVFQVKKSKDGKKVTIEEKQTLTLDDTSIEEDNYNQENIDTKKQNLNLNSKIEKIKTNLSNKEIATYKQNPTSLPGYNPQGKFGFRYNLNGREIVLKFSTNEDNENAKDILDVHYMDGKSQDQYKQQKTTKPQENNSYNPRFSKLKGYNPNGRYGFKYQNQDVRFDTENDMTAGKRALGIN